MVFERIDSGSTINEEICRMKPVGNTFVGINFLKKVCLVKHFHDDLFRKFFEI